MSRAAILCSMMLCGSIARADDARVPAGAHLTPVADVHKADAARHLRDAGIITTAVGTIMAGVGVGLMVKVARSGDVDDGALQGPGALLGVGLAGMVGGAPMWAVGQARVSQAEQAHVGLSGGGLRVTF